MLAFLDPAFGSLTDGLGILFLLILFRLLLRRTWLACIAAAVLFSLIITWWDDPFWIYWPLALVRAFAWVALMLRLGLLGTLAALCAWYGLNSWPVRMDVAWLASWSLVWPLVLAGLAAWGFRIALGEKRPFGKLDLDA